jgi:hypothetical protein
MKGRTHAVATREKSSAVMDEYAHNRERAVGTLKQRFGVRLQQLQQKLKRDLRELKDGELQKMCVCVPVPIYAGTVLGHLSQKT